MKPGLSIHLTLAEERNLHNNIKWKMLPDENGLSKDCLKAMSISAGGKCSLARRACENDLAIFCRFWISSTVRMGGLQDVTGLTHNCWKLFRKQDISRETFVTDRKPKGSEILCMLFAPTDHGN